MTDKPLSEQEVMRQWHPRSEEVMRRLGRNVLLFQMVELGMKVLVPYAHPDGARASDEAFFKLRKWISDQPLGKALEKFKESITHDSDVDAKDFDEYVKKVLNARNAMTHGLISVPGLSLQSEQGCEVAINLLDEQIKLLEPLLKLVSGNATLLGVALRATDDDAARAIIAAMGGTLEIKEYDPTQGLHDSDR